MRRRAAKLQFKGQVAHRHEANALLTEPGAAVLVHRGVDRSIAIACPDGCKEQLTINLDRRAGAAWRYYRDGADVSLFPSVWRDTGCKSHFIVWRSRIYWCDHHDELETPMDDVVEHVRAALTRDFVLYVDLADQLGLVPWAVLSACNRLCRQGAAIGGTDKMQGHFKSQP